MVDGGPLADVTVVMEGECNGSSELTCRSFLTCKLHWLTLASNFALLLGCVLEDEHIMLTKKWVDLVSINIMVRKIMLTCLSRPKGAQVHTCPSVAVAAHGPLQLHSQFVLFLGDESVLL